MALVFNFAVLTFCVFNNLYRTAQTFLRTTNQKQRANRINRHALPSDDLTNICRIQAQLVNCGSRALHRRDHHGLRMLHESFDNVFEELLHGGN